MLVGTPLFNMIQFNFEAHLYEHIFELTIVSIDCDIIISYRILS